MELSKNSLKPVKAVGGQSTAAGGLAECNKHDYDVLKKAKRGPRTCAVKYL
jgi:hypothetical protein